MRKRGILADCKSQSQFYSLYLAVVSDIGVGRLLQSALDGARRGILSRYIKRGQGVSKMLPEPYTHIGSDDISRVVIGCGGDAHSVMSALSDRGHILRGGYRG